MQDIEKRSLSLLGQEIQFTLRKSAKAKRVKLQISLGTGLEVVIPARARVSSAMAEKFILKKQRWVLKHLKKLESTARESDSRKNFILFLGREAPIEIINSKGVRARAFPENGSLKVKVPDGKKELAGKAITAFYKKQAAMVISKIVGEKSKLMHVSPEKISIRDQRTRWGSCSSKGTLSFSWRLVAAPRPVIEYLAVHELAHLKHRNHSKAFWCDVELHCPDYRQQEKWLRKNKYLLRARTTF